MDSYLYAKSQNDLASNSGDIADPRILQSEWLKAIPNHTHPKKDSYSFTFLYVIFHEKKQNKYADKKTDIGDTAAQKNPQSDWLTSMPDHAHSKRELGFFISCIFSSTPKIKIIQTLIQKILLIKNPTI